MNRMMKTALGTALATLLMAAGAAHAKCTVTLKLTNGNGDRITVLGNDSQSRVNGLTWSKMGFSNTVMQAGAKADVPWTTNFSCGGNAKRDLRFKYQSSPNNQVFEEMVDNIDVTDGVPIAVTLKH